MRDMVNQLAFALIICLLTTPPATSGEEENTPLRRMIMLSDLHGVCSERQIPGIRRSVYHSDFMTYTVSLASNGINGEISGSFGDVTDEFTAGFSADPMDSGPNQWVLLSGERNSRLVFVRKFVAGTTATIFVERDDGGVKEEAIEMLRAMFPCEARRTHRKRS